jgi:hypothetical protein
MSSKCSPPCITCSGRTTVDPSLWPPTWTKGTDHWFQMSICPLRYLQKCCCPLHWYSNCVAWLEPQPAQRIALLSIAHRYVKIPKEHSIRICSGELLSWRRPLSHRTRPRMELPCRVYLSTHCPQKCKDQEQEVHSPINEKGTYPQRQDNLK